MGTSILFLAQSAAGNSQGFAIPAKDFAKGREAAMLSP